MSLIRFRCPACGQTLAIGSRKARSVIRCLKCKAQVRVPEDPVLEGIPLMPDGSSAVPSPPAVRAVAVSPRPSQPAPVEGNSPQEASDDEPVHRNQTLLMGLAALGIVGCVVVVVAGILLFATAPEPQSPSSNAPRQTSSVADAKLKLLCFACFALGVYIIPTLIAFLRDHHNKLAILAVNLFLGWNGIGWLLALIWALTEPRPRQQVHLHYSPDGERSSANLRT